MVVCKPFVGKMPGASPTAGLLEDSMTASDRIKTETCMHPLAGLGIRVFSSWSDRLESTA